MVTAYQPAREWPAARKDQVMVRREVPKPEDWRPAEAHKKMMQRSAANRRPRIVAGTGRSRTGFCSRVRELR